MAGYSTPSWANGTAPAINAANMVALGQAVELAQHPYGVCSTAAATAAKTVTIDFSGTLALFSGLTVRIKFTNANSASAPTLNVNGTGAKSIKLSSSAAASAGAWVSGQVLEFVYDGTSWVICNVAESFAMTAVGTYTGDGTYGQGNKKSLSFNFTPEFVVVNETDRVYPEQNGHSFTWYSGITASYVFNTALYFEQNGQTLSWYSAYDARNMFNLDGTTYYYFAIGKT